MLTTLFWPAYDKLKLNSLRVFKVLSRKLGPQCVHGEQVKLVMLNLNYLEKMYDTKSFRLKLVCRWHDITISCFMCC